MALSPHYPSWGFETDYLQKRLNPIALLITPHGDLKQPNVLRWQPNPENLITPHGDLKRRRVP